MRSALLSHYTPGHSAIIPSSLGYASIFDWDTNDFTTIGSNEASDFNRYLLATGIIFVVVALILIVPYVVHSLFSKAIEPLTQANLLGLWLRKSFHSSTFAVIVITFMCLGIDTHHYYKGLTGFDQEHQSFYIMTVV